MIPKLHTLQTLTHVKRAPRAVRPLSIPAFYRVSTNRLTTDPFIEVSGDRSSGEVEFVLVQFGGHLYVGVGSDHTDRRVETYIVEVAKQMCDEPLAGEVWPFADVDHAYEVVSLPASG
jgi:hypothetical protein